MVCRALAQRGSRGGDRAGDIPDRHARGARRDLRRPGARLLRGPEGSRPDRAPDRQLADARPHLYHEYGHHLDAWRGVAAIQREPNGSASWAVARGIPELLAAGQVAHDYSLGWERSIGEIFAEDYAQLHQETPFKISWLAPPTEPIRAALRSDLENVPATPTPVETRPPVTISRSGTLRAGAPVVVPFELLGPGRRVTFSATVATKTARARMELRCTDGRSATRLLGGARRTATIDLGNLGPARCTATLRSTGKVAARYSTRVRLAVEQATA